MRVKARTFLQSDSSRLIGERVKELREGKGRVWTIRRTANMAKIDRSDLSRIERGRANPTLATLNAICEALGTDLISFLRGL